MNKINILGRQIRILLDVEKGKLKTTYITDHIINNTRLCILLIILFFITNT